MADSNSNAPITAAAVRPNRPLSEALLNEKWDHCLSTLLIRSTLGASFGVIFSVLLFKRRSWPVFTGLGFGAGRAWEECDSSFKRASATSRSGLRTFPGSPSSA
ncbi:hypothetical protein Q7P35_009723 [Cladosporium inversicolor]